MPRYRKLCRRPANKRMYRRHRRGGGGWGQKPLAWYAKKAWAGVKMLKGIVNSEKGYADVSISGTPGTTAAAVCLNPLAQGVDDGQRKGDSILAKYLTVREKFQMNAANTDLDVFRCVYVIDKENRGAAPAWTDVFDATSTYARLNRDNMDRFVIMEDKTYTLSSSGTRVIHRKKTFKLDLHLKYAGNAGDLTDCRQNAIYRMVLATENTNKTAHYCESRIAFYDN